MFLFQVSSRRTGQHVPERVSSPTSDGGKHRGKRTVALLECPEMICITYTVVRVSSRGGGGGGGGGLYYFS